MAWSDFIPPAIGIAGMFGTQWLFNRKTVIEPIARENLPDNPLPSARKNFTADLENLAKGWQAIVDLTYAFLGSFGTVIGKAFDGTIVGDWLICAVIAAIGVLNGLLLVQAKRLGPVRVVSGPWTAAKTGEVRKPRRFWHRLSMHAIAEYFGFYSNVVVLFLLLIKELGPFVAKLWQS